jgi:hypothetical protein
MARELAMAQLHRILQLASYILGMRAYPIGQELLPHELEQKLASMARSLIRLVRGDSCRFIEYFHDYQMVVEVVAPFMSESLTVAGLTLEVSLSRRSMASQKLHSNILCMSWMNQLMKSVGILREGCRPRSHRPRRSSLGQLIVSLLICVPHGLVEGERPGDYSALEISEVAIPAVMDAVMVPVQTLRHGHP